MQKFWAVYMAVNLLAIGVFAGTIVWAAFDVHNRITYVILAQIPPLLMMILRRKLRRKLRAPR